MKLSQIKPNPNNPRLIKDERFEKLCKSIQEAPKFMALRPIIIDGEGMILGGNMRYKALLHLGYKEVPDAWVKRADDLTEEERRRFIISDNVGFGEWEWETVANEWDVEELADWGLDVPDFAIMPTDEELIGEHKNKPATMKITFASPEQLQVAEIDIQELLDRKYKGAYFSVSAGEL
jgi:ParB-like chromosome segregation protein Spo0J